jgi:hypothetical protein
LLSIVSFEADEGRLKVWTWLVSIMADRDT